MSDVSVTQTKPQVKLGAIVTPSFDLSAWTEVHRTEAADDPDFVQSTTFPSERGVCQYAGPGPAGLPHEQMTFSQRVNLLRGPAEQGID